MGHSSIPSLNKVGQSNYWNFMWDDKHNFKRSLNESLMLQEFISDFFEHFSYKKIIIKSYKHDFFEKNLEKYNIFILEKYNSKKLINFLEFSDDRCFFSKIWVIKYQRFVIVYFFMYASFLRKKRKITKKKNIFPNNLNLLIKNYISGTIYLKYEFNSHSSIYLKKIRF